MRTYHPREGQIVRVVDGPFTGFCGEVKEVDEKSSTVKVSVQVYGRMTPVDVAPEQIERVAQNSKLGTTRFWHEADIKQRPLFGRCGVESGHHRLIVSISAFDPTRTFASRGIAAARYPKVLTGLAFSARQQIAATLPVHPSGTCYRNRETSSQNQQPGL